MGKTTETIFTPVIHEKILQPRMKNIFSSFPTLYRSVDARRAASRKSITLVCTQSLFSTFFTLAPEIFYRQTQQCVVNLEYQMVY
ncbi:hypothetical protein NSTC745_04804 [Nostoc sp. DSM 114161]|jgi:hypothetical protein